MKRGHVPVRTCLGCRKKAPGHELRRFVLREGRLVEDTTGTGYGLYCCPGEECWTKLLKKLRKQIVVRADKEDGSN